MKPTTAPSLAPVGFQFTDADIAATVDAWLADAATTEAQYGHPSTWDVSLVTNFRNLFRVGAGYPATAFNELVFMDRCQRKLDDGGDIDGHHGVYFETLLYTAAENDWCSAMKWLIAKGANLEEGMSSHFTSGAPGWSTPLHVAVQRGNKRDAAVILLDAGARVNARNPYGRTALHLTAQIGEECMGYPICKLLLVRGASLRLRDKTGRIPEATARYWGHTELADFLSDVRTAGGWLPWVSAPRAELLSLRQRLPLLRATGRAAPPSSVPVHENLFLKVPDEVFANVLQYWRSARDP